MGTCLRVPNLTTQALTLFIHRLRFFYPHILKTRSHMILRVVSPFSREGDFACMNKFIVKPVCLFVLHLVPGFPSLRQPRPAVPAAALETNYATQCYSLGTASERGSLEGDMRSKVCRGVTEPSP